MIDEQYEQALRWLSSIDPSSNHNSAHMKHEPTTGEWFLESDDFKSWEGDSSNNFLWLHGKRRLVTAMVLRPRSLT